ncbi:MAG: ATP-binding protein [Actinomycetota bacterium]|nr:ATP-binding protein [Actinomycetota bacterium]
MSLHLPLKHRFAADVEALPLARILVRHWLADGDMGPDDAEDVLFAANELCTHAVQACPGGWCQLEGWEDDEGVRLEVTGQPSATARGERIVHLAPGSPALELLERLCEKVEVDGGDGVLARCSCRRSAKSGVSAS